MYQLERGGQVLVRPAFEAECAEEKIDEPSEAPTRGNLVPDAHIASILAGHGVTTPCTHDRDFRKFSFSGNDLKNVDAMQDVRRGPKGT
jgi:predicted nucleic acid-binding protein